MNKFVKIASCALLVGAIGLGGAATANAATHDTPGVAFGISSNSHDSGSGSIRHGHVGNEKSDVISRAAMPGNKGKVGSIEYEPQSVEGPKGFSLDASTGGPKDGQIASAGHYGALPMDQQKSNLWEKNQVNPGTVQIGWRYTAAHKTSQWHYYITKNGWDQNSPLKRAELQPLATISHDGSAAPHGTAHDIKLPADHTGYHVIIAVWDVADTTNAFYSAIDVNIAGDAKPPVNPPVKPPVDEPVKPPVGDPVKPPVDEPVTPGPDTTAPSVPSGVHSMGTTTKSVDLMWGASTDNVGVDHYEIQRTVKGGTFKKIGTTTETSYLDEGLKASTTYQYRIIAKDAAGNSATSATFTTTTKPQTEQPGATNTWKANGTYKKGDRVTYEGATYQAVQDHKGYGDPNWIKALSLWKKVS